VPKSPDPQLKSILRESEYGWDELKVLFKYCFGWVEQGILFRRQETQAARPGNCLSPVVDVQLVENIGQVPLDRA